MEKRMARLRMLNTQFPSNKICVNRIVNREELQRTFENLAQEGKCDDIIEIVEMLQTKDQPDHWLLIQLASAYHLKSDFGMALEIYTDAMWIEYDCPTVRWCFAYTLMRRGQFIEAIEMMEELMSRGAKQIAEGPCGRGSDCDLCLSRAEALINDARFVIAVSYLALRRYGLSRYYLNVYKLHINRGVESVFPTDVVNNLTSFVYQR
ncbi:MAG: hypothetical protein QM762_09925 [Chryseolinea sp.]